MAAKLAKIRKLPAKSEEFTLSPVCIVNNELFLCPDIQPFCFDIGPFCFDIGPFCFDIEPFCFDIEPFSSDIGCFYSHSIVAGGFELMS